MRSWSDIVCMALAVALAGVAAAQDDAMSPDKLQQLRKAAAHRQRRIIYDNDGNEPVYYLDSTDADMFLEKRTKGVLGTQVDTIVYCTWSSGFSIFTHNTKIGEIFDCTAEEPEKGPGSGFSKNKTGQFIEEGTDPLEIMVDYCRQNDIEVFWSMRMNDVHDAWGAWYSPYLFPKLKKDHPEWLMGTLEKRPVNGGWTAVDFGQPEIRDLAFRFIEEVCTNYDIDGVQMDFFRHLNYFRAHAEGREVGQAELDMMTDLIRRIRTMADEVGRKRGKPILLSVRVPDSVEICRAIGFDIERWMEEGLIDLLVVSGYFRLNPWETSVALGHKYNVPVYPCLSETRLRDAEAKKARASLECYRARASEVWNAGADGVYMFNFFHPNAAHWKELGSPETLKPLDKVFTTGARGIGNLDFWYEGGEKFVNRSLLSPVHPRNLKAGQAETAELIVGENLAGQEDAAVTLRLRIAELADPTDVAVTLNGTALTPASQEGLFIDYPVAPAVVKQGTNMFEFVLKPESEGKPVIQDMQLWLRHGNEG
jgi:Glycosyl hydrolase-like 10